MFREIRNKTNSGCVRIDKGGFILVFVNKIQIPFGLGYGKGNKQPNRGQKDFEIHFVFFNFEFKVPFAKFFLVGRIIFK